MKPNVFTTFSMKIPETRHLGGEVPEPLIEELDALIDRLGFVKKRVFAAAILAFLRSSEDEQFRFYREVYSRYYADDGGRQSPQKPPTGKGK